MEKAKILEKKHRSFENSKNEPLKKKLIPRKEKSPVSTLSTLTPLQKYEFFVRAMNFSNNISINPKRQIIIYRVYVGKGNNHQLIKTLMRTRLNSFHHKIFIIIKYIFNRHWWTIVKSIEEEPNFMWTQTKNQLFLNNMCKKAEKPDNKQIFSLLNEEKSPQSSSFSLLSKTSIKECLRIYSQNPLLSKEDEQFFADSVKKTKSIANLKKNIDRPAPLSLNLIDAHLNQMCIHNHFLDNYHLGNKKSLYYHLKHYCQHANIELFSIIPLTFHIRKGTEDPEFQNFSQAFIENPGLWIIKPGERSNRGNGISICKSLEEIKDVINKKETHKNGKIKTFVLQKYIEKPYLFNKRKFDIRCYMLLTNFNNNFKAFWYKEGYIRTSSKEFSLKNANNKLIHLTNDAIQKKAEDYGKHEPFNKVSIEDLAKFIESEKNYDYFKEIQEKMKSIATVAVKSVFTQINQQNIKENCFIFEIFGLDFMIDDDMKVWLLEINTNPCLETTSPLLNKIIPNMIENALK